MGCSGGGGREFSGVEWVEAGWFGVMHGRRGGVGWSGAIWAGVGWGDVV